MAAVNNLCKRKAPTDILISFHTLVSLKTLTIWSFSWWNQVGQWAMGMDAVILFGAEKELEESLLDPCCLCSDIWKYENQHKAAFLQFSVARAVGCQSFLGRVSIARTKMRRVVYTRVHYTRVYNNCRYASTIIVDARVDCRLYIEWLLLMHAACRCSSIEYCCNFKLPVLRCDWCCPQMALCLIVQLLHVEIPSYQCCALSECHSVVRFPTPKWSFCIVAM